MTAGTTIAFSATATYGENKPLEVLSRLVQKRMDALHEAADDAAVATVITALKSIRVQTRRAKKTYKRFSVVLMDQYVPSMTSQSGGRQLCVRAGSAKGARIQLDYPIRLAWPGIDIRKCKTFFIRPSYAKDVERSPDRPFYVFAYSEAEAAKVQLAREERRFIAHAGLARFAEGIAMSALSTRETNNERVNSSAARALADRLVRVMVEKSGEEMCLTVRDSLNYATLAVKGGSSGVEFALKKAANSVVGMIKNRLVQSGRFDSAWQTPFPEVKGAKVA